MEAFENYAKRKTAYILLENHWPEGHLRSFAFYARCRKAGGCRGVMRQERRSQAEPSPDLGRSWDACQECASSVWRMSWEVLPGFGGRCQGDENVRSDRQWQLSFSQKAQENPREANPKVIYAKRIHACRLILKQKQHKDIIYKEILK